MAPKTATVASYLAGLPDDRRRAISAVRTAIRKSLPRGIVEGVGFGMITYSIPLSRYPATYNGQPLLVAALASQKSHMAVYLQGIYADPALRKAFEKDYAASGKKLDMGKSCVRFQRLDDLAVDVVARAIAAVSADDFIAIHERARDPTAPSRAGKRGRADKPRPRARA